mgnify:CR=1 FL=1
MIREKSLCGTDFSTTTAAMSMEKRCGQNKIPGRLIPVPREITAGCGLAWKMSEEDYEKYKDEVEELNICSGAEGLAEIINKEAEIYRTEEKRYDLF